MTASLEIQGRIYDALRQHNGLTFLLGGPEIHDDVPHSGQPPYIVFGEVESLDWSTSSEAGEEHFVSLEIWSGRNGRKQALEIAAEVRSALDALSETLPALISGHYLINLATQSTITTRQEKNRFFRTVLTVRAVSELAQA